MEQAREASVLRFVRNGVEIGRTLFGGPETIGDFAIRMLDQFNVNIQDCIWIVRNPQNSSEPSPSNTWPTLTTPSTSHDIQESMAEESQPIRKLTFCDFAISFCSSISNQSIFLQN